MNAILVPENVNRSYMMKYLIKNGIETRPTFPPLGQHPYLKKEKYTVRSMGEKVSEDVWNRGLLLPSAGKGIDEDAVKDICKFANAYIGE
jgi:dTDP-4-amino-4,6-dideoxygalactose transaminase